VALVWVFLSVLISCASFIKRYILLLKFQ
jgi:hypothetical protein